MESLTLGDVSGALAFIAGILASGGAISVFVSKRFGKVIEDSLRPTNKKIDEISKTVSDVDMANCKNYLVQALSDLESGSKLDKVALERFWENYDHYTALGGNSYIHTAVEKLKREGKL